MSTLKVTDLYQAVPDTAITVEVDEGPGEGNSAPTRLVFHRFDTTTGEDQEVRAYGEWERDALIVGLRKAADALEALNDGLLPSL